MAERNDEREEKKMRGTKKRARARARLACNHVCWLCCMHYITSLYLLLLLSHALYLEHLFASLYTWYTVAVYVYCTCDGAALDLFVRTNDEHNRAGGRCCAALLAQLEW